MPVVSPIQGASSQASFHTATLVQEPVKEHPPKQDPDREPANDPEPLADTMSTNPGNTRSKGPAMAKPTPFNGNRKQTEQFLHKIDLMILARKSDFPDEFAKITYALSYMKGESAGIWGRNFTAAQNMANDWGLYAWKDTTGKTSVRKKISTDFEEFNKQADARDKLARLNQGKESFNAYLQLFEQVVELSEVDLETKKTHFL